MVVGQAEIAITMCFRPSSIRLRSRSRLAGQQLDRAHLAHVLRTGSVVGRTRCRRSTAPLGFSRIVEEVATERSPSSAASRSGAWSKTWMPMSEKVLMMASIASASTRLSAGGR